MRRLNTPTISTLIWAAVAGALFGQAYLTHGAFAWLGALAYGFAISSSTGARWRRQVIWATGLMALVTGLHGWGFFNQSPMIYGAQALYLGFTGLLVGALLVVGSATPTISTVRLAIVWIALEAAHQIGPVGYPLFLGGTQPHLPTRSALGVIGACGLSGLIMATGLAVAVAVRSWTTQRSTQIFGRSTAVAMAWIGAVVAIVLLGTWQPGLHPSSPPLDVALVQGSVPTSLYSASNESEQARRTVQDRYFSLGSAAFSEAPDLVIFPENALQRPIVLRDGYASEPLFAPTDARSKSGAPIRVVAGAYREVLVESGDRAQLLNFNAAFLLESSDPYRVLQSVDKQILAPLAEAHLSPGHDDTLIQLGEIGLGVLICYESMYPRLARSLAESAEILVVLTNDAGFGYSRVAVTHARQGWARAIETGRPLVRAAQSGISLFVDHEGRLTQRLGAFEVGVMASTVQPVSGWTWFSRFGYLIGPLSLAWMAVILLLSVWPWVSNKISNNKEIGR